MAVNRGGAYPPLTCTEESWSGSSLSRYNGSLNKTHFQKRSEHGHPNLAWVTRVYPEVAATPSMCAPTGKSLAPARVGTKREIFNALLLLNAKCNHAGWMSCAAGMEKGLGRGAQEHALQAHKRQRLNTCKNAIYTCTQYTHACMMAGISATHLR